MVTCRVRVQIVNNTKSIYNVIPYPFNGMDALTEKDRRFYNRNFAFSAFPEKFSQHYVLDITLSDSVYNASYDVPITSVESYTVIGIYDTSTKTLKEVENSGTKVIISTYNGTTTAVEQKITPKPNISEGGQMITFGYQVFKASSGIVYTPTGISMSWGKEVETQGTVGKKPVSYMKSVNLITANFKIHASRYLGVDPDTVRGAWSAMAETHLTYGFLIGGKYVGDRFIVKSVKMDNTHYNGKGELISADFDISVEEYAGENYKLTVLQEPTEYD